MKIRTCIRNFLNPLKNTFRDNRFIEKLRTSKFSKTLHNFLSEYWLLFFFILLVAYLELLYRLWIFKNLNFDYFYAFIFSISGGTVLYILVTLIPVKAVRKAAIAMTFLVSLVYGVQLIYYCIFHAPLSLISIGGAGDAMQFWDIIVESVYKNILSVIMLFLPFVLFLTFKKSFDFKVKKAVELGFVLLFCIISYSSAILCVSITGDGPATQYTLYFKDPSPELSMNKLGVLTSMRLDLERLATGTIQSRLSGNALAKGNDDGLDGLSGNQNLPAGSGIEPSATLEESEPAIPDAATEITGTTGEENTLEAAVSEELTEPAAPLKPFNVMDIDFETLLAGGESDPLYPLHKYFSSVQPTATNEYTGMFKGCNLIMLTAEGFSPYAVSPELTPTLYKMSKEGFVFNNFYNPVWWVSTSDGEYVACTGLIPKSGVWSFYKSGSNYMPFTMGNQFRKLGYPTRAYHNHTYTYYKRDISHPNMGYDYKGVGNGLVVKKSWPESDLEMINVTADEYIGQEPFHTYYMTVSGHMNYNFFGNYMSSKNKQFVEHLPYSDQSKAYIACNLELEFALKALMEKLEAAGIAENTVIALSADHYPYGLDKKNMDELAGHEVESNFELFKSTLILYKKGMEPVIIDKPCASLDIIPTLSNLFGLEYDSRLLMGTDILSDTPALVIFSNRSWITDRASFNSVTNSVVFRDGTIEDKEYVKLVNRVVADKFKNSAKILETDYYGKILKDKN